MESVHAGDDSGAVAPFRHSASGEEGQDGAADLAMCSDLDGESRTPWRRGRRLREREGGRGPSMFLHISSWAVLNLHSGPSGGVPCNFFAPKIVREGDRLEPARPGGDRATWRVVIGRNSGATVPRAGRAVVADFWPSDRPLERPMFSGWRG